MKELSFVLQQLVSSISYNYELEEVTTLFSFSLDIFQCFRSEKGVSRLSISLDFSLLKQEAITGTHRVSKGTV